MKRAIPAIGFVAVIALLLPISVTSAFASAAPSRAQAASSSTVKRSTTTKSTTHSTTPHTIHRRTVAYRTTRRRRTRREPVQLAPTPDRIREIQTALVREGYLKGDPSGKWDADTTDAMERFQQNHALNPTGKLDALSLQKLGLGSEIAGVSAPQPAVPISAASQPADPKSLSQTP